MHPLVVFSLSALAVPGSPVRAVSPPHVVPLVELYTSEGCSSCPPADALLGRLGSRPDPFSHVVPLSYHVTYWNHIGWTDRFSQERFDERQQLQAALHGDRIYTPQIVIAGGASRPGVTGIETQLDGVRGQTAVVSVTLAAEWADHARTIALRAVAKLAAPSTRPDEPLTLQLVVFERALETRVTSGENGGRTLRHDYVVRSLPGATGWASRSPSVEQNARVERAASWKPADMGVAAFVQGTKTLRVYQATAVMLGRP